MMSRPSLYLMIPLVLSAFTHLWNPIGFPDFFSDEGVYLRRALHVLEGLGPQETETYYDNHFFGQIFLAGVFYFIGYPNYLNSSDVYSTQMLFTVPRIIMGLLGVIDTFLIFKIAERQYNYKVAIIASILFTVMPMSWFMRRILLENLQLPFLLSSILLALSLKSETGNNDINREKKETQLMYSSQVSFLGLLFLQKSLHLY